MLSFDASLPEHWTKLRDTSLERKNRENETSLYHFTLKPASYCLKGEFHQGNACWRFSYSRNNLLLVGYCSTPTASCVLGKGRAIDFQAQRNGNWLSVPYWRTTSSRPGNDASSIFLWSGDKKEKFLNHPFSSLFPCLDSIIPVYDQKTAAYNNIPWNCTSNQAAENHTSISDCRNMYWKHVR